MKIKTNIQYLFIEQKKKAKDIVNYREKNGLFKTIEDIMKVNGIGDSFFAQIKENITV